MEIGTLPPWLVNVMAATAFAFVVVIVLACLTLLIFFIYDITQRHDAIRRNFPVIGRLRGFFTHLGTFFRQYFFAMDRAEMPFNRTQRDWVNRAVAGQDNTVPFGSTRNIQPAGTLLFANTAFPALDTEAHTPHKVVIGPGCAQPYEPNSFFNISAMSYGALSHPAVRALSLGAARAGCWMNTGEGGLAPYHLEGGCDIVFQIGTAKYGVRDEAGNLDIEKLKRVAAHDEVKMIEIKLSQGAKPGKGGILPAVKVTEEIAAIRHIPEGMDSISPNRHLDIGSIGELLDYIARLRDATGLPVGFKAVIGDPNWLDQLCRAIHERHNPEMAPDFITIDSADGGTGAAPLPLIDYVGLSISESLPLAVDKLVEYGLRDRVKVIASGKLITPGPVAWALAAGADFVNNARGFMFSIGCIQAMQCNKNTCPTGVTTHKKHLQRGLVPEEKADDVANYVKNIVHEVGVIAHSCGLDEPRKLKRHHCRMVLDNGRTAPFDELFPDASPIH